MASIPFTYVVKGRYWRFRRGALNVGLPGAPGDPLFHARYAELLRLSDTTPPPTADASTVSGLIAAYRASAEFAVLRAPTQLDYSRTLDIIDQVFGVEPHRLITARSVKALRDRHAATPRKAHKLKQVVSRLYTWGQEEGLVRKGMNPAGEFKRLKVRAKTITPWSDAEIALFLAHAPQHLRLAVTLMLYTGQRGEDVATMEWTAYGGGYIRVRQSKTDEPLDIACHKDLSFVLDKVTIRKGRICRNARGQPYTANALRKAIADAIEGIEGMPARSPHGLRYASAGMMEAAGCTVGEITAVIGHRTYQMAMKYLLARRESAGARDKMERRA